MWLVSYPPTTQTLEKEARLSFESSSCSYAPEPELFHSVFPFHMVIDKEMTIRQVWDNI